MKSSCIRLFTLVGVTAMLISVAAPAVAQTNSDQSELAQATVTVIHAIPADDGFPADVYLNGELAIDGFVFSTKTDAFTLAPGEATLEIFPDGADPATEDPAVTQKVTFEPGVDYSLVASLVDEAPVLSVYENDVTGLDAGQSRLTIRQTSMSPALDVLVDGEEVVAGLMAPEAASIERPAGEYAVTFVSGAEQADQALSLGAGELTIVYAVGWLDDGTFQVLRQTVLAQTQDPTGVPTGTGGTKADGSPGWSMQLIPVVGIAALALLALVRRGRLEDGPAHRS